MLGYCLKDEGKDHFDYVAYNISPLELRKGIATHLAESKSWQTNKIVLNKNNIIHHMFSFCKKNLIPCPARPPATCS